jgi:hypothetical protein
MNSMLASVNSQAASQVNAHSLAAQSGDARYKKIARSRNRCGAIEAEREKKSAKFKTIEGTEVGGGSTRAF